MTATQPIRVLVADDHLILRLGLVTLINGEPDMRVVGEASSGQQVIELFRAHRPDVTLMDLRMPGVNGVEAISSICAEDPAARVIVLTIHKGDEAVHRAIQAGARGYLLKDVPCEDILAAIRTVHQGRRCIPPAIAARIAERLRHTELTPREIDVLKLIGRGLSNKQIGERLGIAEATVKNHVVSLLAKLEVQDRTHAVTMALERNIIDLDDVSEPGKA